MDDDNVPTIFFRVVYSPNYINHQWFWPLLSLWAHWGGIVTLGVELRTAAFLLGGWATYLPHSKKSWSLSSSVGMMIPFPFVPNMMGKSWSIPWFQSPPVADFKPWYPQWSHPLLVLTHPHMVAFQVFCPEKNMSCGRLLVITGYNWLFLWDYNYTFYKYL